MGEVLVQLDEEDDLFMPVFPGEIIPLSGVGLMGLIPQSCFLQDRTATLTFTFDDALIKMTRIQANNNSGRPMVIEITSPRTWSQTLANGESVDRTLTGISRLAYQMVDTSEESGSVKTRIGGIEWRIYLTD